jgi:tetratricopeptide (TPR) repeat protein
LAAAWLKTAGDSSQIVDVATAKRHYARALELASTESAERLPLLIDMGEVLLLEGDFSAAADILEGAVDSALELVDAGAAVRPMLDLAFARVSMGIDAFDLKQRALALARQGPPSRDLIDALDVVAIDTYLRTGDQDQALAAYEEAEALCRDHGLAMSPNILATRGAVRCTLGDLDGLEDYRRALEIAQSGAIGRCSGFEVSRLMADYGVLVDQTQGPVASADVFREAIEFCKRRGMLADALVSRSALLESRFVGGDWEGLSLALQEMVVALVEGKVALAQFPRAVQCILKAALGDLERLEEIADALAAPWDSAYWAYEAAYMAVGSAAAYSALGRPAAAKAALVAWAETPSPMSTVEYAWMVPEAVRIALRCSGAALAGRLQSRGDGPLQVQQHVMTSVAGLTAEAAGGYEEALEDYVEAVSRWHEFGVPYEKAQALLGQGRCLVGLGRAPEAAPPLAAAREIFARLGAKPALADTDELIQKAASA